MNDRLFIAAIVAILLTGAIAMGVAAHRLPAAMQAAGIASPEVER